MPAFKLFYRNGLGHDLVDVLVNLRNRTFWKSKLRIFVRDLVIHVHLR